MYVRACAWCNMSLCQLSILRCDLLKLIMLVKVLCNYLPTGCNWEVFLPDKIPVVCLVVTHVGGDIYYYKYTLSIFGSMGFI